MNFPQLVLDRAKMVWAFGSVEIRGILAVRVRNHPISANVVKVITQPRTVTDIEVLVRGLGHVPETRPPANVVLAVPSFDVDWELGPGRFKVELNEPSLRSLAHSNDGQVTPYVEKVS